jgi:hypothetical protein
MRGFALLLLLVSCSGDTPPEPDGGNHCAGEIFDLCSTEHDCTSAMCQLFMADGFQVCTQVCDATTPCPADKSGNPATCNMMGICKPVAANACHL